MVREIIYIPKKEKRKLRLLIGSQHEKFSQPNNVWHLPFDICLVTVHSPHCIERNETPFNRSSKCWWRSSVKYPDRPERRRFVSGITYRGSNWIFGEWMMNITNMICIERKDKCLISSLRVEDMSERASNRIHWFWAETTNINFEPLQI
jgi:hypothetical protein